MKKSYFRHDYNARNDIKLQSVITKHGAVGIGVYWIIVEMLYQNGGELPLDIARNISVAYFTDFKVVESVINDFDLFENDGNVFWSVRIRQTIDNTKKVSDARKAASRQRWSRKQEKPEIRNPGKPQAINRQRGIEFVHATGRTETGYSGRCSEAGRTEETNLFQAANG